MVDISYRARIAVWN